METQQDVILFNRHDAGFTHPRFALDLLKAGFAMGIVGTEAEMRSDKQHREMAAEGKTASSHPNENWDRVYLSPGAIMRQGWHFRTHREIEQEYGIRFTHFNCDIEDYLPRYGTLPHAGNWGSSGEVGRQVRKDASEMIQVIGNVKALLHEHDMEIEEMSWYGMPRRKHSALPKDARNPTQVLADLLSQRGIRCGNAIYPRATWDTMRGPAKFARDETDYEMVIIYPCWQERAGRPYVDQREYLEALDIKPHTQCWLWDNYPNHGKNAERQFEWAMRFAEVRKEMRGEQQTVLRSLEGATE